MTDVVFIVDDDDAVRDSLGRLLESAGFTVMRYPSAEAFLLDFDPLRVGCLLLDVSMPGMSGLELADILAARGTPMETVYLTAHGDIPMTVRAMRGGAVDFLEKPAPVETLIARLREALTRERTRRAREDVIASLTTREREVMQLAVEGLKNKEIARRLKISHRTVELHRSHLMQKLKVKSLLDLASLARRSD